MMDFDMNGLAPWAELGAVGCLIVTVLWLVTKGFPAIVDRFTIEAATQRQEFREELKEHRDQSRELAESGHAAVHRLADSFDELKDELKRDFRSNGK